jgi:hypothetical protein
MYADLQALEANEVHSAPLTYFELVKALSMFGNLLGVTLASTHVMTVSYRQFWYLLTKGLCNNVQFIVDHTGCIKPAHILWSIQHICYAWFNHRHICLQPPDTNFVDILTKIMLQTYVMPHLPPALFKLAHPQLTKFQPSATQTVITTNTVTSSTLSDNVSVLTNLTIASMSPTALCQQ